jgi:hypothetical protein
MHGKGKRISHGTVAGYLGLMFGVLALTGGSTYAANLLDGKMLRAGSVKSAKLAKNSVTAVKLHKASVTAVKLAKNAVTTAAVKNGSITAVKLAKNAVTSPNVAAGTLQASDFSTSAYKSLATNVSDQMPPATSADLAASAVTSEKLADGAVTTAKLADGSVTGPKIPLRVVTEDATLTAISVVSATALCPVGTRDFGGGITIDDPSAVTLLSAVRSSRPAVDPSGTPTGWTGTAVGLAGLPTTSFHVYAVCG